MGLLSDKKKPKTTAPQPAHEDGPSDVDATPEIQIRPTASDPLADVALTAESFAAELAAAAAPPPPERLAPPPPAPLAPSPAPAAAAPPPSAGPAALPPAPPAITRAPRVRVLEGKVSFCIGGTRFNFVKGQVLDKNHFDDRLWPQLLKAMITEPVTE